MEYNSITSRDKKEILSAHGEDTFSDLIKIIPSKFKLNTNLSGG